MKKFQNIEFLRVIGCISIILLHLFNTKLGNLPHVHFYHKMLSITRNGQKAVDLFFILSGCFFAITFDPRVTTAKFMLKKIARLYPVLVFGLLIYFIMALFGIAKFAFYNDLLILLLLNGTTLSRPGFPHMAASWYVSAMLWVFLPLYFSLRHFDKNLVKLVLGILAFFSYCLIITSHHGKISAPSQVYWGIISVGMLRAIGGIGLGYLIGDWYKENKESIIAFIVGIKTKILLTIIEFICIFFIINNLFLHKYVFTNDILYIAAYTIITVLFLSKKGVFSEILDKNIWSVLARYTYAIYMTHQIVYRILSPLFWEKNMNFVISHPIINFIITISLVIVFGAITYHLIEVPCSKYIKGKINTF